MNSGTQMNENDNDNGGVQVVVNPYNFNNRMITEGDIKSVLQKYDISDNIVNLDIYQKAFIHKSYSKKDQSWSYI